MVKFHKSFTLNFFIIFLIFSCIISLTNEKKNLKNRNYIRKLEDNTDTDLPDATDTVTVTDTVTDSANATLLYKPSSEGGLSGGAIAGIIIPCVLAVGGVGAFAALTRGSPVPGQLNSNVNNTNNLINVPNDSKQNIREIQISQPEIIQQNPAIPIGNEVPGVINQSIPNQQVIVSQSQIIPNNNEINAVQAF